MAADTDTRMDARARAEMLDRCAGDAYRAGNHGQALRLLGLARAADPSMAPQLDEHRARAATARLATERGDSRPLAAIVAARLADAGVTPDDPALRRIAEHNTQALARAGGHAGPSAAQPTPAPERFRQQVLEAAAELEREAGS